MSAEDEAKRGVFFGRDLRNLGVNSDYFTVIVPYVDRSIATEWHPTVSNGPFSTLSRGVFATKSEATTWAMLHLGNLSYQNHWYVKEITHCKRCGEYKETHQVYCGASCSALAEAKVSVEEQIHDDFRESKELE